MKQCIINSKIGLQNAIFSAKTQKILSILAQSPFLDQAQITNLNFSHQSSWESSLLPWVTHCPDLSGNPDFENQEIRKIRIFEILSEENNSTLCSNVHRSSSMWSFLARFFVMFSSFQSLNTHPINDSMNISTGLENYAWKTVSTAVSESTHNVQLSIPSPMFKCVLLGFYLIFFNAGFCSSFFVSISIRTINSLVYKSFHQMKENTLSVRAAV